MFISMQAKGTARLSLASHFIDAINAGTGNVSDQRRKENELAAALGNVYLGLSIFSIIDATIITLGSRRCGHCRFSSFFDLGA